MQIRIEPRKATHTGGIVCLVKDKSLQQMGKPPREDWERTTCPICGDICYLAPDAKALMNADPSMKGYCTECALKSGMEHKPGDHRKGI